MVLESLINPLKAEKKPWEMFFFGILYSSVAVLLSLWIFEKHASLIVVFLTVMACIPLVYSTIKSEEKKDLVLDKEKTILKEHSKVLYFLMLLFLGITVSIALWYIFLPTGTTHSNLFSIQQQTIAGINTGATTNAIQQVQLFTKIFFNNMKVLTFCLLFAFIYGVGAIFIITWNASVIGVAIGNVIRSNLGQISGSVGLAKLGSYFNITSYGLLRYFIHGIPEIAAYFIGGLAGGIISIAIIRHDFRTRKFEHIILDSTDLIIISVLFLLIAALIEVYITPVLF